MSTGRRTTGRPRDPDVERRAFEAARHIYGLSGKSQVTFANVAARAGIGKPALYRRWETPGDLLIDALRAIPLPEAIPDLGDIRAELAWYASALMALYVSPDGAAILRVTTEFHDETEPFRDWMAETSKGMIGLAAQAITRAIDRGEPAPALPADNIMEILTGTMLSHTMVRLHAGELPPEGEVKAYCWGLAGLVLGRVDDRSLVVPPPATAVTSGGRRGELIRIAQHVVAQRGFGELTLAEVAEAAGVTTPALYTHFSSRTDLLEQVLEATARDYIEDMRCTDDSDATVEQRLRTRLSRWAATPTARLRILHDAVLHMQNSDRIALAARRALAAWDAFVRDTLALGITRGEVRPDLDVDAAIRLLSASVFGVEVGTDTGLSDGSMGEMNDELVDMFLAYVRPAT